MLRLIYFSLICFLFIAGCGSSSDNNSPPPVGTDPIGLTERPSNTSCLASNFVENQEIQLTRVAPNLSFTSPILLLPHPNLVNIYYLVEQTGSIYRVDLLNQSRALLINLSDHLPLSSCGECGLLGMTFHPDFSNNGHIYLSFNEQVNGQMVSYISRFISQDNGLSLLTNNGSIERLNIFNIEQPFSNHNGGHIDFGPDQLLYIGLGDGGSGNDPINAGQDISTPLGAILRLNDDGTPAAGNNVPGASPEIYAYGLRNPWRWSFDRQTGQLWLGDVGQNQTEEIDIIVSGGNYGWRCFEGTNQTTNSCTSSGPYIEPVTQYNHSEGNSITGGYVYRGNAISFLQGVYLFADFGSGTIWGLYNEGNNNYRREVLLNSGENISSFAQSPEGELFVIGYGGAIYQIEVDNSNPGNQAVPTNLSETGCVSSNDINQAADGLIPYTVNESFWSDNAEKERYLALPDNTLVDLTNDGDFLFPVGTVLVKNFRLNGQKIETRLFMHSTQDQWNGYSYQWNPQQTEATLVTGSADVDYGNQTWHYPSSGECNQCHTSAANFSLGLESLQLNRNFTYPSTGISANQLTTLEAVGIFSAQLSDAIINASLVPSNNQNLDINVRARSYLHANCAGCHQPGGTTQSEMDLRFDTSFSNMNICQRTPLNGDLGITGATLLEPSDPDMSILYSRISNLDANRMPPISTNYLDDDGALLVRQWIENITSCN